MSSIVSAFKNNTLKFYIQHQQSEFVEYQIINQLVGNYEAFELFVKNKLVTIKKFDDYVKYLIYSQILAIKNVDTSRLDSESNDKVKILFAKAEKNHLADNGILIKYVNSNYEEIFQSDISHIKNITINVIAQFANGIGNNMREYLIKNYPILLIQDFDKFQKWFIEDFDKIPKLINVSNLEESYWTNFSECLRILKNLQGKKDNRAIKVSGEVINHIFDYLKERLEANFLDFKENREFLLFDKVYSDFQEFLVEIQSPLANDFKVANTKMKKIMDNYLTEHGQSFSFKLTDSNQLEYILREFKSPKGDIVKLTHFLDDCADNEAWRSRLSTMISDKKGLLDIASSSDKTNDYFTQTHQLNLDSHILLNSFFIKEIVLDAESLRKFQDLVYSRLVFISDCLDSQEDLEPLNLLFLNSISFLKAFEKEPPQLLNTQCYNVSVLAFVSIEKLLLSLYLKLVKAERYVPNSVTLGPLLASDEIKNFFGIFYIKNLSYFLSTTDKERIGYDYRNRFIHHRNIRETMLTIEFASQIIYLFLDILNTIFLYCQKQMSVGK